jgi:hypothetical protein
VNELGPLGRVHLFPVRHHSPRSSAVLAAFLAEVQPKAVLIEGPDDADKLIPTLVHAETRPPVAILGYRTDGPSASSLWPFAAYSPEYVAAKWGVEHGAEVAFIDVPISRSLGDGGDEPPGSGRGDGGAPPEELLGDTLRPGADEGWLEVPAACAAARGFRSFEEFWEASFEAPAYDVASFRAALIAYADLVRAADRGLLHRARDAYMARKILARVAAGVAPESIVVVVGAAHAAAFAAGEVDFGLLTHLPEPVQTEATLIPFSFPRLAGQLGYGAGNRAPQFYQRAHEAGCSYKRATLEVLIEFTEHLRLRGFMASLADTIEAYRLAMALADLRGKAEPGLDEVREATIATMCRGDATHVDGFLWPSVIGRHVGRVAARSGKNSLEDEFWREVRQRRLPVSDSVQEFSIKLHNEVEIGTSVFLHRLELAAIPYASFKRVLARAGKHGELQDASGAEALSRTNEVWEAQWTPSTDLALIERIVLGNTLEDVTAAILRDRLAEARSTGEAAQVLIDGVVTASAETRGAALARCESFAATDDDLTSLATASRVLSAIISIRTARAIPSPGDDALPALCRKTFDRAVLRARGACACDDEAAPAAMAALHMIHEVALTQPLVDRDAWFAAAREIAHSYTVNPAAAGLSAGLLYLAQVLHDDDVALLVGQRLSAAGEPDRAAAFLEGFFKINALALVRSRPVVAALDAFLGGLDGPRFRDALPVLRRAFGSLGATERRYLLENVLGARRIGENARAAQAVLLEKDKNKLAAMSPDLAQAMDDLDDLL